MLTLILLGIASFVISLAVTPRIRDMALRRGWVDLPDSARKIHTSAIPRVGGIAVLIAYIGAIGLYLLAPVQAGEEMRDALRLVLRLLPAAAVVFATGFLDDRLNIRPWQKLAGQFGAAVLACLAGVQIHGVVGRFIEPWIGVPLTLVWLVACTNALNLIDGVDGLAAGIGLFATCTAAVASLLHGDLGLLLATAPLIGALAGFLRYNFNPATVFLGDAGSLLIGLLLGCYSVVWSHKSATLLGMTAPLIALAIPLADTSLAVIRRFIRSRPIFGADRAHIHHRLLDLGLTPRRVVLLLYGVSGIAAVFALLVSYGPNPLGRLVFFLFCIAAWLGIRRLGYDEFRAVGELLRLRLLRGLLDEQLRLRSFEESLGATTTPDECWRAVRDSAREFGFNSIAVSLQGETHRVTLRHSPNGQWSVRIPLPGSDYVYLTREFQGTVPLHDIDLFVEFLYRVLTRKLERPKDEKPSPARARAMAASAGGPGADSVQS